MNFILFDEPHIRTALLPLTFTRPVAQIRIGIVTIADKWRHFLRAPVSFLTEDYLQGKFPVEPNADNLYVNGAVCPDAAVAETAIQLKPGESLLADSRLIAFRTRSTLNSPAEIVSFENAKPRLYHQPLTILTALSDIFTMNGAQIRADFAWLTADRACQPISDAHTIIYNPAGVFLEKGSKTRASVLNAEKGPIYIGANADIQEGSLIRGPFAIGEGSVVAMGAKMRGDITVGPFCKVGGEVSNSVIFGYSSKGHEGYLGNSVIGEWCNLGADTNTSNLKNDYATVKQWSYAEHRLKDTGRQFVGLVMGDHSKAGINTMFNTGTVVGVNANVFGGDFPPKFVPSFTWGGAAGLDIYRLDKALEVMGRVLQRRNLPLPETDRALMTHLFELTHGHKKPIGFGR